MALTIVSTGGGVVEVNGGTGVVTTNPWRLARIRWVFAAAAAGNACIVTDTPGNIIFESEATGADWQDEVEMSKVLLVNGVKINTLSGGNVYFYLY